MIKTHQNGRDNLIAGSEILVAAKIKHKIQITMQAKIVDTGREESSAEEDMDHEDSQYGHLVAHLVRGDEKVKATDLWTRVFTRDVPESLQVSVHRIGDDLIFDKSLRDAMSSTVEPRGSLVFSPFMIPAQQISQDLATKQLKLDQLMGLASMATMAINRFKVVDADPEDSKEPSKGRVRAQTMNTGSLLNRGYCRKRAGDN